MSQGEVISPRDVYRNKRKSRSLKSNEPLVMDIGESLSEKPKERSSKHGRKSLQELKREIARTRSTADTETVMINAIVREDVDTLIRCLEEEDIRIDHLDSNGFTALQLACETGNLEIVRLLIDAGADLFIKSHTDETALQIANRYGQFEIAEFLISIGANETDIKDGL